MSFKHIFSLSLILVSLSLVAKEGYTRPKLSLKNARVSKHKMKKDGDRKTKAWSYKVEEVDSERNLASEEAATTRNPSSNSSAGKVKKPMPWHWK